MSDFVLLCDQVIRDEATKKYSLIGLFDRVHAVRFPAMLRPFFIFCELSHVEGFAHAVAIRDLNEDIFLGEIHGQGGIPAGLAPDVHLVLPVPGLAVKREGPLTVELRAGDRIAATANLVVDFPPPPRFREFSREELGRLLADPSCVKGGMGEVVCGVCGEKARYALSLDPYAELPEGARPFPGDLVHACPCGAREWLAPMKADLLNRLGTRPASAEG